jgi:hypothetical protein
LEEALYERKALVEDKALAKEEAGIDKAEVAV